MTVDELGFDPDKSYTQEDNPFWDATDAAHPAWWRGEQYGFDEAVRFVNRLLDGEDATMGTYYEPVEQLRKRLKKLVECVEVQQHAGFHERVHG